jgi:cysteine-rich repeat protein
MPRRKRALAPLLLAVALALSGPPSQAGPPSSCGNGSVEPPEPCDDGNATSGDGCSFPSCLPEVCGDFVVNPDPPPGPAEQCDDGGTQGGDGCDASCKLECGNGALEGAEACDTAGESATCDDDCTAPACGDGHLNESAGEGCDDGNVVGGDGCEADCSDRCSPTTKQEVACAFRLAGRLAGVARARAGDDAACLRAAAAGRGSLASCLGLDLRGKVARAAATTLAAEARQCAPPPPFAYTSGATVNAAGEDAAADAFAALLGASPAVASRAGDRAGARCQRELLERHGTLLAAALSELARATRDALRGSRLASPVCTATGLAAALEARLAASPRLARAADALGRGVRRRCDGADVGALFDCGGAATVDALVACARTTALRAACEAAAEAEGLDLDCG